MVQAMRSSLIVLAIFLISTSVRAGNHELNTLPWVAVESKLPAVADDFRKALKETDFGAIGIRQRSLALRIDASTSDHEMVRQHAQFFEFHVVPVTFSILGFGSHVGELIQFSLELPQRRVKANDAYIVDVFPRAQTSAGRLAISGNVEIGADLGFRVPEAAPVSGGLKTGGKASVEYKYNPLFQQFAAVFDDAKVIWQFARVGDQITTGPIDLLVLVAVRIDGRIDNDNAVVMTARMRADFGGTWFSRRIVQQGTSVDVQFPDAQ